MTAPASASQNATTARRRSVHQRSLPYRLPHAWVRSTGSGAWPGWAQAVSAWKGAGELWRAILDLGYALTGEGESEIGALRRPDPDRPEGPGWRGKVRMVLHRWA
jgi:hypothetical protein